MPRTSRDLSIFPIAVRTVEVRAVHDLSPNLRRITVAGPDLAAGTHDGHPVPAFRSEGFDDHVKLILPRPEGGFGEVGTQDGERFAWDREALARTRDYTVRAVRGEGAEAEVDLDVVVHDGGIAADWARGAAVGDPLKFAGPKSSATVNDAVDWHLLIADETALPAVARWLEEAPATARAIVLVEVPSAEDRLPLPTAAQAEVRWLVRPADVRPGWSPLLLEAVRDLEFPPGRVYAWCAGESITITPIRRHLRGERGLDPQDVEVVGYWRRVGESAAPAVEPSAALAEAGAAVAPLSPQQLMAQMHELAELLPPLVVRVAVTLGVPTALAATPATTAQLAAATGVPQERLLPLLEAMAALDLLLPGAEDWRLSALGEVLLEETAQQALDLDAPPQPPRARPDRTADDAPHRGGRCQRRPARPPVPLARAGPGAAGAPARARRAQRGVQPAGPGP